MTTRGGSQEWPHFEHYSDIPMFNTKAVVQQTGIPAPTLRAWERRYALLNPERAENAYRLYTERDIVLIRWLKEHVDAGMAISHAVALFRHLEEEHQAALTPPAFADGSTTPTLPAFQVAVTAPLPRTTELTLPEDLAPLDNNQDFWEWSLPENRHMRSNYPTPHNMRVVRDQLIEVFQHFDEQAAHIMMGSLLSLYSVEQVCTELIVPTMWHVGQLWAEGAITVSVEHFASHFMRSFLMTRFHITPGPHHGPLVLNCCAPGEPHELAALMLALFIRLQGIHVVYLGQSIEISGLLHTIKQLRPVMVCVSLTMAPYLPDLISLGQQIHNLPEPRPLFVFGGQAFAQYATIIPQIPGCYMDGDLREITAKLHAMIVERPA